MVFRSVLLTDRELVDVRMEVASRGASIDVVGFAPRNRRAVALVACAIVVFFVPAADGALPTLSLPRVVTSARGSTGAGAPGVILFRSNRDGVPRYYVVNGDGSGLKRLQPVCRAEKCIGPVWSPDGSKLAYTLWNGSGSSLVVVARSKARDLAPDARFDFSWSPDGRRIVFNTDAGLEIVNVISGRRSTVTAPPAGYSDMSPKWSPAGGWIAFVRAHSSVDAALYVVRPDGSGVRSLAGGTEASAVLYTDWSPDGRRLVFSTREGIFVTTASGGSRNRIASASYQKPSWSPRGNEIALIEPVPNAYNVFLVHPDGRNRRRVFSSKRFLLLSWSPDGRRLAVAPDWDGDVFVIDVVHGRTRTVTQSWRYGYSIGLEQWHPRARSTKQLPGAPVAWRIPTDSVATPTALRTRYPITQLTADGAQIAFATGAPRQCLELWQPGKRAPIRFPGGPPGRGCIATGYPPGSERHPFWDVALGGTRVAFQVFSHEMGTNSRGVVTGTRDRPNLQLVSGLCSPPMAAYCIRPPIGDLVAHGSLFAFDSWAYGGPDFYCANPCPPPKRNGGLWRLEGTRAIEIATSAGALTPLSVDAGRILVDNEDGTLDIRTREGRIVRSFAFDRNRIRRARLQGRNLVVQTDKELDVIDAQTGQALHRWPLPATSATLADLQGTLAVLTTGPNIYLLRLADGRTAVIQTHSTTPVIAQVEPPGLYYATTTTSNYQGRIAFIPTRKLPIR